MASGRSVKGKMITKEVGFIGNYISFGPTFPRNTSVKEKSSKHLSLLTPTFHHSLRYYRFASRPVIFIGGRGFPCCCLFFFWFCCLFLLVGFFIVVGKGCFALLCFWGFLVFLLNLSLLSYTICATQTEKGRRPKRRRTTTTTATTTAAGSKRPRGPRSRREQREIEGGLYLWDLLRLVIAL